MVTTAGLAIILLQLHVISWCLWSWQWLECNGMLGNAVPSIYLEAFPHLKCQGMLSRNVCSHIQGRNHVFKVGGPIPCSRVLLPFYRKKLDRFTQFGAVGNITTLYSSKNCKKLGSRSNFGKVRTARPPSGCAHDHISANCPANWWTDINIVVYIS